MLSVLCKINSRSKPPSPFSCILMLRGWCARSAVPVSSQRSETSRGVTLACSDGGLLLKHTCPLVFFVAVLNCLLFPCVLAHYFSLIHGLCNYLGNAGELAGVWWAWLTFLGVGDFVTIQHARVWFLASWRGRLHSQASLLGLYGTGWLF